MNTNLFTDYQKQQHQLIIDSIYDDDDDDNDELLTTSKQQQQQQQQFGNNTDENYLSDDYTFQNENENNNNNKYDEKNKINNNKNLDYPPYSRLFVLYPKTATESELKCEFEKYGPVEDIWIVKEKETASAKGIAYIKYSKASQAAKAIEELNGKLLNNKHAKPLKVIISNSKNDKKLNISNNNNSIIDNDRMLRLFVVIPKDFRKKDLRDAFKKFGEIENVQIIFNRLTNENKGFGYVRFYKASDAARALEECHPKFKPKFAEPYSVKLAREREKNTAKYLMNNSNSMNSITNSSSTFTNNNILNSTFLPTSSESTLNSILNSTTTIPSTSSLTQSTSSSFLNRPFNNNNFNEPRPLTKFNDTLLSTSSSTSSSSSTLLPTQATITKPIMMTQQFDDTALLIQCKATLSKIYLNSVFNLIPGLIECRLLSIENRDALYLVQYENSRMTKYAFDKLNKFLFPTGEIMTLTPINLNDLNILTLLNKLSLFQISTPSTSQLSTLKPQQQQQQQQIGNNTTNQSLYSSSATTTNTNTNNITAQLFGTSTPNLSILASLNNILHN